jgi:Flp pilus assembly pilin Flp
MRRWLRDRVRGESGLAVIEYALLVALMTVPALKATEYVMNESSAVMDRNVGGIQTGEQNLDPPHAGDQGDDEEGNEDEVDDEVDPGGEAGDGDDETTTSTAAPTTTTTAAPTTTTTTAAPASSNVSVVSIARERYSRDGRSYWRVHGVSVRLQTPSGQGVAGATVTVRLTASTGTTVQITCVTSSSSYVGTCIAQQPRDKKFRTGGSNEVEWVDVQIVGVSGGTPAWTGPAPAAERVTKPS